MFGFGITELLVVLAIVVLLFGTSRLGSLGSDLGNAIKGFRSAVKEEEKPELAAADDDVIEGETVKREKVADDDTRT